MSKLFYLAIIVSVFNCNGQKNNIVGGGCDGCELMYVGMPKTIQATDASVAWKEKGQKLTIIGKVVKRDGVTPAPNVIIYYWQTDQYGYYTGGKGKAKKHGRIRGWVQSDAKGNYTLHTIRPAPYPNRDIPAHIHLSIKEPNIKNEYYIDNLEFDDDSLLTDTKRKQLKNRGGSGILKVEQKDSIQIAKHTIILGLHIPNYPENR
jgi:protocatechuate 3,4-dioxygenase beta subunit